MKTTNGSLNLGITGCVTLILFVAFRTAAELSWSFYARPSPHQQIGAQTEP